MNKKNKEILDRLLPNVKDGTISETDKAVYDSILQNEWDRINKDKAVLLRYYPFATCGC